MKNLDTKISEIITTKLEKRQAEVKKLKDSINSKAEKAKALQDRIDELTLEGSESEYVKAKRELDDTMMIKKLNEDRLNALQSKPLASQEERQEILRQINEQFTTIKLDAEKQMGELAEKMYNIASELSEQTEKLNEISLRYQKEICKMDDSSLQYCDSNEAVNWGLSAVIDHPGSFTEGTGRKYIVDERASGNLLYSTVAYSRSGKIVPCK